MSANKTSNSNGIRTLVTIALAVSWSSLAALQDGPRVTGVHPASQSMVPGEGLAIFVDFDRPVAPQSVDGRSFEVFGRWTGVCPGQLSLENGNQRIRFTPAKSFSAGEWITVSLSTSIESSGGAKMATGYAWNFWTAARAGSLQLVRKSTIKVQRPDEAPIRTYGAYAGDLNGDGFHDFTVPNEDASDVRVFLNDGRGNYASFTRYDLPKNSKPSTNEGADFDGDGFIDFACGNIDGNSVTVFMGDGAGHFVARRTYPVGAGTRGLAVIDLDGDGATDIVTANRTDGTISSLINRGDGQFLPARNQDTGTERETACAAADFNEDGILDVAVGSYSLGLGEAHPSGDIVILLGDGRGRLQRFSKTRAGGDCWMLALGDMDADGHVDVVSANSHQNQFALLRGDGHGRLSSPRLYDVGLFPLAIDVGDLDGDHDLDVVTSNFASRSWTLYENDGRGHFSNPKTFLTSAAGSCAVLHDRDRDGDLDMTGIDELDNHLVLFENPATPTTITTPPLPTRFRLHQSYPNPFSQTASATAIEVRIPFTLETAAEIKVELFNIRGQKVVTILHTRMPEGDHVASFAPRDLPPGVYFYRLSSRGLALTQKLLLFP
ncbi:MAG: FG-GAP-like repeat-containing protein [bacterium]